MGEADEIDFGLCRSFGGNCKGYGLCIGRHQLGSDAGVNKKNATNGGMTMSRENARSFAERCIVLNCQQPVELRKAAESEDFPA